MTGVTFDNLSWLNLLWAVLAVVAIGVYGIWQRRRAMRMFAPLGARKAIAPPMSWGRPVFRLALVALAMTSLVAALIGPRWGEMTQKVVKRGIDVMVLLDVSRSMLARDIAPNRLERAKISIRDDLLPVLGGDRIGLITFAGAESLKCPLTSDYGFFRLALDEVSTKSSPRGGTKIGDAIRKAGKAFGDDLDNRKIILLITDGEDHDSFPVEAAQGVWDDYKIPIVAVALGDESEGARIPVGTDSYLEHEGAVVWSKANFGQLRRIAGVSDLNALVPVGTRDFDLGGIYRDKIVPAIDYQEREESEQVTQPLQYHPFAVLALALVLLDSFLRDGTRRIESAGVVDIVERSEAA
jgi:Ca-activated chloride channel family protein